MADPTKKRKQDDIDEDEELDLEIDTHNPWSPADDQVESLPLDHPLTDTNIDEHEWYDEGHTSSTDIDEHHSGPLS